MFENFLKPEIKIERNTSPEIEEVFKEDELRKDTGGYDYNTGVEDAAHNLGYTKYLFGKNIEEVNADEVHEIENQIKEKSLFINNQIQNLERQIVEGSGSEEVLLNFNKISGFLKELKETEKEYTITFKEIELAEKKGTLNKSFLRESIKDLRLDNEENKKDIEMYTEKLRKISNSITLTPEIEEELQKEKNKLLDQQIALNNIDQQDYKNN